jgi:fatty acid desaturase
MLSPARERKQRQIDAKLERRQTIVRKRVLAEREAAARRAARRKFVLVAGGLMAACVAMWLVVRWFGINVSQMLG